MPRRLFRKLLPTPEAVHGGRVMGLFGKVLHDKRLWQLNRHSVATGVGWGLFWAFVPTPGQTVAAAACALPARGNVPLAVAATWVSNPLSWLPCVWVTYHVGVALTGYAPTTNLYAEVRKVQSLGLADGLREVGTYVLIPLLVGGVATGAIVGGCGYFAVKGFWRWNIARRWHRRGHRLRCGRCRHLVIGEATDDPKRVERVCPACGAKVPIYRRLGLGFAAMARRLRERDGAVRMKAEG